MKALFKIPKRTVPNGAYFMLGMWDGTVEAAKGLGSVVAHPIESAKSFGNGIAFVAKAIAYDGEERKALYNIWTSSGMEMLADLEDDEAKDTARKFGKFTAEILLMVAAEKGITKATTALKESAKTGKLSKVSKAWVKTGQKADDFVDDLVAASAVNKFDDFAVIANKFPDEVLPTDGFILATTIKDGKIAGLNGLREADFVIKTNGEIVIGFRHTVLANGDDVLAAGRLKFDGHGKIRRVTNESGHYRPSVDESMQFAEVFKEAGLDISSARANYFTFTVDADGDITRKTLTIDKVME